MEAVQLLRDSDYWYDFKTNSSRNLFPYNTKLKRIRRQPNDSANRTFSKGRSNVVDDDDYSAFLKLVLKEEHDDDDHHHHHADEEEDLNDGGDEVDVEEDEDEEIIDPQYKSFLEGLREDGKSYIFEMKKENGTSSVLIKYDDGDDDDDEEDNRYFTSMKEVRFSSGNNNNVSSGGGIGGGGKMDFTDKNNVKPLKHVSGDTPPPPTPPPPPQLPPRFSSPKPGPTDGFLPFLDDCRDKLTSAVDDSYYVFLTHLRVNGNILMMESDGDIVTYEEDNVIPSDSQRYGNGGTPYCQEPGLKPSAPLNHYDSHKDEDDGDSDKSLSCDDGSSEYERKLKKCLKMPYNEKEYQEKYREAIKQKHLERHRYLRGRSVSYATEKKGRSYLDHHPDLKEMINLARSLHDVTGALSLLRCLFFYYQNVSHEGVYMPWKYRSILEKIVPRVLVALAKEDVVKGKKAYSHG